MGKLGKKVLGAVGGILGGEASKSALAKKAYNLGIGNEKMVKSAGRKVGEKLGSYLPFKSGGVVVVLNNKSAPKKRKARKGKK